MRGILREHICLQTRTTDIDGYEAVSTPTQTTKIGITGSEASDHPNKFGKTRESVFLYTTKANQISQILRSYLKKKKERKEIEDYLFAHAVKSPYPTPALLTFALEI